MKIKTIRANFFNKSGRLDAKYYLSPGVQATNTITDLKASGVTCASLDDFAEIWTPNRFKSAYAASNEESYPYLKPYHVFQYLPVATHNISIKRTKDVDTYKLNSGTILQTCSGRNLGPSTMVDEYLSAFIIGADMIRIEIKDERKRFYVLAYLQSEMGQNILKRGKTGSVIDHLSKNHIGAQEIPFIADDIQEQVSLLMKHGYELREEARLTLKRQIKDYENLLPMYFRQKQSKNGWSMKSLSLPDRLDAAHYDPLVKDVRESLLSIGGVFVRDVASVIKPKGRYKTIYVSAEYGKPILSGTQLLQEYPVNLRFIAPRAFKRISDYELRATWTAYQADGRVERDLGKPQLITSDRDGWLASGHVGRLKAKPDVNPGWLYLAANTWHSQIQIKSKASGSVVDSTFPEDMENVVLPPELNVDGNLIIKMWELFVEAKASEQKAIGLINNEISKLTP